MGGLVESARREWYWLRTGPRLAQHEWDRPYWREQGGSRIVACTQCPKFDQRDRVCSVPFGSPVRKCVVAALESHLHRTAGMTTLELGYGRRSLAKRVIEASGGSWTGLEPHAKPVKTMRIGTGGYGHAGNIPFPAETFDLVFGIQSFEHWGETDPNIPETFTHEQCLKEVWRVLKPGGQVYFDAPIHLHGHEMFVLGDMPRILALFDPALWTNVVAERWRYDHDPLPRYPVPEKESAHWPRLIESYSAADVERVKTGASVSLLALTAEKKSGSD